MAGLQGGAPTVCYLRRIQEPLLPGSQPEKFSWPSCQISQTPVSFSNISHDSLSSPVFEQTQAFLSCDVPALSHRAVLWSLSQEGPDFSDLTDARKDCKKRGVGVLWHPQDQHIQLQFGLRQLSPQVQGHWRVWESQAGQLLQGTASSQPARSCFCQPLENRVQRLHDCQQSHR